MFGLFCMFYTLYVIRVVLHRVLKCPNATSGEDVKVEFVVLLAQLMWAIVTQKFETVVQTCELANWKEALAVVLTYAAGSDFNKLCG